MTTTERRSTDEIISVIQHRETQRKLWLVVTVVAFIVSTAFLIRNSGHGWTQEQTNFVYGPALNAGLGLVSFLFYRARVRGGERTGFVVPFILALLSCVVVWMVTH